jgi:hypothetical protein
VLGRFTRSTLPCVVQRQLAVWDLRAQEATDALRAWRPPMGPDPQPEPEQLRLDLT